MGIPNDKIPNDILKIIGHLSDEDAKAMFTYIRGLNDKVLYYWEMYMGEDI